MNSPLPGSVHPRGGVFRPQKQSAARMNLNFFCITSCESLQKRCITSSLLRAMVCILCRKMFLAYMSFYVRNRHSAALPPRQIFPRLVQKPDDVPVHGKTLYPG